MVCVVMYEKMVSSISRISMGSGMLLVLLSIVMKLNDVVVMVSSFSLFV